MIESFNSLFISKRFNLLPNLIADLQAVKANIRFLTSSNVFKFLDFSSHISFSIHKNIFLIFSFFIKSGTQFIITIFQDINSKSNHISSKIDSFSFKILNSTDVRLRLSQIRSP
jgi:hypothetical protein